MTMISSPMPPRSTGTAHECGGGRAVAVPDRRHVLSFLHRLGFRPGCAGFLSFALFALSCGVFGLAQARDGLAGGVQLPDWKTVEVRAHHLRGPVWYLEGFGGNIGVVVTGRGTVLIDDQYAPLTDKIRAALAEITKDPKPRFIINTHWHPDHTGGNERFAKAGAVVIAHDNTRHHLRAAEFDPEMPELLRPHVESLPIVTFNDTVTFHLDDEEVVAFHIPPAHTDGDVVVRLRDSDVIHAGDACFHGYYPYIDIENGGSIDGLIAFWERLVGGLMDEDTILIPGHGSPMTRADVAAYLADMKSVRGRVAAAMKRGEDLKTLIARHPLADLDPKYESEVVEEADILTMVWRSLERTRTGVRDLGDDHAPPSTHATPAGGH